MKKADRLDDDMRAEYRRGDLGPLVRGKYALRYAESSNVVVIDKSLAKAFPNGAAVNQALRLLLDAATAAKTGTAAATSASRKRAVI